MGTERTGIVPISEIDRRRHKTAADRPAHLHLHHHHPPPPPITLQPPVTLQVNLLQIIFHFMGGVAVSTFIQNQWPYPYLWVLVALFNVPTALVEFSIIMAVNCFGIVII